MNSNNIDKLITYADIINVCNNSKNIEIHEDAPYIKNEENKKKILAEYDNINFLTVLEYIKLSDIEKKKPVFFIPDYMKNKENEEDEKAYSAVIDIKKYITDLNNDTNVNNNTKIDDINKKNLYIINKNESDFYNKYNKILEANNIYLNFNTFKNYITYYDNKLLYKYIIDILFDELKYISFKELMNRITSMIKLINTYLYKYKTDNTYIIFYVMDQINKSNTWIFVLFMKILINSKKDDYKVFKKMKDKFIFTNNLKDINLNSDTANNYILLHFDDMTYSGEQVCSAINDNYNIIKSHNIISKFKYILVLCYYTTTAIKHIDDNNYNILYIDNYLSVNNNKKNNDSSKFMNIIICDKLNKLGLVKTMSEVLDNNSIYKSIDDINIKTEIKFMFNTYSNHINNTLHYNIITSLYSYNFIVSNSLFYKNVYSKPSIFFNHKLADYYSTYVGFFLSGPIIGYYTKDYKKECLSYPIIKPCKYNEYDIINQNNICSWLVDESPDDEYGCPITYYKSDSLKYIYNNTVLDKNELLFNAIINIKKTNNTTTNITTNTNLNTSYVNNSTSSKQSKLSKKAKLAKQSKLSTQSKQYKKVKSAKQSKVSNKYKFRVSQKINKPRFRVSKKTKNLKYLSSIIK